MICQVGKVGVRRGQRYRLTFWAKAADIKAGGVDISLVNTQPWVGSGLEGTFTPGLTWQRYEFLFQSHHDVPAATSRLQLWFLSTGTLWLDDVTIAETDDKPQWYPQIRSEGVTNAILNSSFECGTAGWGTQRSAWAAGTGETCSDSRASATPVKQSTADRVSRSPSIQTQRRCTGSTITSLCAIR